MLLLRAGRTVPLERLMKAVWEQEPPASARNAVQGYVSRLRRLLAGVPDADCGARDRRLTGRSRPPCAADR
ncbi:helix-turn-helix domain-containing protein [Nonomuraea sp. NPDC003709]|uniref:helix-turn-helix domain-containing protein n=1 Tax=Nonomuraea sp. NPDC003709 TaxID=3154450 RepID=UPI0033BAF3A0